VTNEFIFETQAVFVQYAIIVNNDGTIEAAAQAQAAGLQIFDITHEAKRTGSADLAHKRISREVHRIALGAGINRRMVKVDGKVQRETIVRFEFSPLVAIFDANGLFDANKFLRAVQFFDASIQQQIDERCSTAIHNRDFWRIDFNNNVVDTQARQGGVQVLYGRNPHVMLVHQTSTEHSITHRFGIGRKIYRWIQVGATIDDPGIGRRRA